MPLFVWRRNDLECRCGQAGSAFQSVSDTGSNRVLALSNKGLFSTTQKYIANSASWWILRIMNGLEITMFAIICITIFAHIYP